MGQSALVFLVPDGIQCFNEHLLLYLDSDTQQKRLKLFTYFNELHSHTYKNVISNTYPQALALGNIYLTYKEMHIKNSKCLCFFLTSPFIQKFFTLCKHFTRH